MHYIMHCIMHNIMHYITLQYASLCAYCDLCMLPGPCGTQRNTLCMLPGPWQGEEEEEEDEEDDEGGEGGDGEVEGVG